MLSALANPRREAIRRLVMSANLARELTDEASRLRPGLRIEVQEPRDIDRLLPPGAVHQGIALLSDPLEPADLMELADTV